MGNDTTLSEPTGETQNGSDLQVETTTQETGETPESSTAQPSDDTRRELERLKAALKRANAEAKQHREQATELANFKKQVEAEKLSTEQKQELARQDLEKQVAELQSQLSTATRQSQERLIGYEVRLQAAQMGIVDPDAAAKLLNWAEIEYDEDGAPTNIEDLLKALVRDKKYLVSAKSVPSSGGATNPSRSTTASASAPVSWEMIGKLTQEQYAARRHEIQQWMSDPKNHRR